MKPDRIYYQAHFEPIDFSIKKLEPTPPPAPFTQQIPPPRDSLPLQPFTTDSAIIFSRSDLEHLASGTISHIFGDWFKPLDEYERLIRMPMPPLLLADRVTKLVGIPGQLGPGSIWTETTVTQDAWYLHQDHMPAGIMIEAGQADLLLVSWLGMDFHNRGERVYRLLGCELTYFGPLPNVGDVLCFQIHIEHFAKLGEVRLFFFHYDCYIKGELRLQVRHGQAGFFSDDALQHAKGILWDPAEENTDPEQPLAAPKLICEHKCFSKQQIIAFSKGEVFNAFGKGFERACTHTRTPRISDGNMLLLDDVTHFERTGGPSGRGYMRARQHITPDRWFFKGHFKNDPCMPGTLMLEAGLQAMAIYLTALGYTLDKDGWRFEPIPNERYTLRCRGQVTPTSQCIVYELFIVSLVCAPLPTLHADLLITVDGLKAFHTKIGIHLTPDWPLAPNLVHPNEFSFDENSLLACAIGKPSSAFGAFYEEFDNHRRVPRLPGPPYHFMSRICDIPATQEIACGGVITTEYDVPEQAWYFEEHDSPALPFCVLLEIGLQPCGWFSSFMGGAKYCKDDLFFRNLDGVGTLYKEPSASCQTLTVRTCCTTFSHAASMLILEFFVEIFEGSERVYSMETVFGFFPACAFSNQPSLPTSEYERETFGQASNLHIDFASKPSLYFDEPLHLAHSSLLMIDSITGFWRHDNKPHLATVRAEKKVNPSEWFFKAHFFQDPVQPGSLGIESLIQLLKFYMIHEQMGRDYPAPRFSPIMQNNALTWKYRGQVTPENNLISLIIEVTAIGNDERGSYAYANGSLWVDGMKIYDVNNLGIFVYNTPLLT